MRLTRRGTATTTILVAPHAGRVEQAAAKLFADEVATRTGEALPIRQVSELPPDASSVVIGTIDSIGVGGASCVPDPHRAGESYAIGWIDSGDEQESIVALGSGERGALYAATDLLDRLRIVDSEASLDRFETRQSPTFEFRAWHQAGAPLYAPDGAEHVDLFLKNIRYVARHRGNAITLGQDMPDSNSALIGYHHFPALHAPEHEPELERRRQVARCIVDAAAGYGIDVFLTLAEFRYPEALPEQYPEVIAVPPPGSTRRYDAPAGWGTDLTVRRALKPLCASHPTTWAWYRAKVRELFEHVPDAAGLELWVSWADSDLLYCACRACAGLPMSDRILRIVDESLAAMDLAGGPPRQLLLSTYLGGWRQILEDEAFRPLAGRLDPRVTVRHKSQLGDFYLGNIVPPLAGAFAPANREVVEFDLGGEYRGGLEWGMIAPHTTFVGDRVRAFRSRGATGLIQRHLDWRNDLVDPEFEALYSLAWDVNADVDRLWDDATAAAFGPSAGAQVTDLLRDAARVVAGSMYVLGASLGGYRLFPESLQRLRHLTFDRSARSTPGGVDALRPTDEVIERIILEKDDAVALAASMVERIGRLADLLPERVYRALSRSISLQYELSLVYRSLAELFWRFLAWESTLSEVEREWRRDELIGLIETFRSAIERIRARAPSLWSADQFQDLGTPTVRWRDARFDAGLPILNLETIADDIESELDTAPASMWGYAPTLRGPAYATEAGPTGTKATHG